MGSVMTKKKILGEFKHGTMNILLMSLETAASGTNLTEANHVLFAHPMAAETIDKAAAYELQALGRVRRFGQKRNEVSLECFELVVLRR